MKTSRLLAPTVPCPVEPAAWLIMLLGFAMAAAPLRAQNTVSGTLTLGNDTYEIRYAAATQVPSPFDKSQTVTKVLLTDKPVPPDKLDDAGQVSELKNQGYHGLDVEIEKDPTGYSAVIIGNVLKGTLSRSQTFSRKERVAATATHVEGLLDSAPVEAGGTTLSYHIEFAADITPPEAPPTPADTVAAAGKESTKAYLALVAAIRSGDKQKILELSPPDKRAAIDTPDFPKMLEMVQMLTPANIKVLKATEAGDRAKLVARGSMDGQTQRGLISLNRVNGKWIVANETWSIQ